MKFFPIFFVLMLTPMVSPAWSLFGPNNYEDCIIDGLKGVTSDIAAREIRKACTKKFKHKKRKFNKDQLGQIASISSMDNPWVCTYYIKDDSCSCPYMIEITNWIKDTTITSITIETFEDTYASKTRRQYKSFMAVTGIKSTDKIFSRQTGQVIIHPPEKWFEVCKTNPTPIIRPGWRIVAGEGY